LGGQRIERVKLIIRGLTKELRAVLGGFIRPGTELYFVGLFLIILFMNFIGLFPYVFTPSSHLRLTLRLAGPLFLGKIVIRFLKQLDHNIAHFTPEGTPGPLMPVIVVIETVRLMIRPGTLAVRLAANIVAGHLLLALLGGQGASIWGLALVGLMVGLFLLVVLECAVACIQAYVFTILSSLYLAEHNSITMAKIGE